MPTDTPTLIPPTDTLQPTNTPVLPGGQIVFQTGETAAVLQGTVQPGQVINYTAQATYAQPMILILESKGRKATLGVLDPNGGRMFDPIVKWSNWQGQLPYTGLWTIQVIGADVPEAYTLTVKIGQLVYFPTGKTSVTLYGTTTLGYVITYAFRVGAGSHLSAILNVPATKDFLTIYGIKSGVLLSYADHATSWAGTLPNTEDLIVEVCPRGGYLTSYALTVSMP